MIAGAVQQQLQALGLNPVLLGQFGDYVAANGPVWVLSAESGADDSFLADGGNPFYGVRLQARCRASNMVAAEEGLLRAFGFLVALRGQTLTWTPPVSVGGSTRSYRIEHREIVTRPTWFPTPEAGEVATSNLRLNVREVA